MSIELHHLTIAELGKGLRAGEFSSLELTEALLTRIDTFEPKLNAFRIVCHERARASAQAADIELGAGVDRGPLHGIPYVAKDLYDVAGLPTSAGSKLLEDATAADDCEVVTRLTRAGMVLLGKTNTVQFAYGGAGINHDHGTPHNPWHPVPHLPGGSSSGTGVAVAAGFAPMGLGSDTGGSVRIPAALNGITGLKTTVGRISRAGVFPLSWTLDSVGPLARDVLDCATTYQAILGPHSADSSTVNHASHDALSSIKAGVSGMRLAFAEGLLFDAVDASVERAVRDTAHTFTGLGAHLSSLDFPQAQTALDVNPGGVITAAEAYTLYRELVDGHFDELDPIVAHRIAKGAQVSAAEYLSSLRAIEALRITTVEALDGVDALLCPAVMIPAQPVAQTDASNERYSEVNLKCLRNTLVGNILNLSALSVPCGFSPDGLPIGLMIYTRPFDEARLLRIGHAFQQATDWHRQAPDLSRI